MQPRGGLQASSFGDFLSCLAAFRAAAAFFLASFSSSAFSASRYVSSSEFVSIFRR